MAHIVQVATINWPDCRCDGWRVLSATTDDAATTADDAKATNLCSASAILAAPLLATVAASVAVPAVAGLVAGA